MLRSTLLAALLLCPLPALAADDPLKAFQEWIQNLGKPGLPGPAPEPDLGARNTFTVSPVAIQYQQLGVEYERAFGTRVSAAISPEFAWRSAPDSWQVAVGGTLGLRFFVLGDAPSGIWFGPEVSGLWLRAREGDALTSGYGFGLGGAVGWSIVFFNRFTVSAGFAARYRQVPDPDRGPDAVRSEINALPRLNFGVAF